MRSTPFVNRCLVQIFILCLMLIVPVAHAQRYLGSIEGQVTDPSGAIVPNAAVTAEETTTHFKTTGAVNGSGVYSFPALNPGTYSITLTATGFAPATRTEVVLTAGQAQVVDFHLVVAGATTAIEVQADSSLIDTGSANISTTLSTQEVTDLPNVGRNPFVQAALGAGVVNNASGGYFLGKESQFTTGGVSVQITTDGSSGHNRLTLDGIPDDPAERFSGATYAGFVPSPEAVQEVKVQTSIFDAQIGHGNGTVTNTVVRNGTNTIHGAAYYVFQNTYLNANTYEKVPNENSSNPAIRTPRSNDQLSQTGFVIDGPVFIPKVYDGRNKTFFLFSYERYASHQAINYTSRVPTAAELAGDFSGLCSSFNGAGLCTSGIQLYDPLSPLDASNNRTVYFPNNNIASRISQQGAALASYFPSPNIPGAAITLNNYVSRQTSYPFTLPALIARLDQSIGQKNKLNAIFFKNDLAQVYPHQGFPKEIAPTGYGYTVYRDNKGGSVDDIEEFSPNLVLDSRFGIIFHPFGLVFPDSQGFNLGSLSIAGANYPSLSFPGTSESDGYAGLAPGAGGQISEDTTGSLEEVVTRSLGHHNVRIGFEGNLLRYNVQNPFTGFGNGQNTAGFVFDRRFTQQNSVNFGAGGESASGDSIASLLLGYPSSVNYNIATAYALQQIYMAPFVQDDWRVTAKLTLNLGLRYDYESPLTERYNKQASNFCTTCSNPLQASVTGLTLNGGLQYTSPSNRYPYPRDLNNIQPRLGAAYQVFPNTVFRGGFGIIYFNTIETPIGTGFTQSTSYNNFITSAPINSLANPYPSGVVLPTGSSLGLSTSVGQGVSFIDPHHVQPKSAQYSVSVQQQFPGNIALSIAYVGTRPTRLEVNHNINVLPQQYYDQGASEVNFLNTAVANPLAGQIPQSTALNKPTIAQNLLLLPYPEFLGVTEDYSSIGSAPYNSLQVQVSMPMKHHFTIQGNFTWDKVMEHLGYLNSYATHLQSTQNGLPTLTGNIFGIYQFPSFNTLPAWERLAIGGWQLNAVFRDENGPLVNAPGGVNIIGNIYQPNPTAARYFNTCYLNPAGTPVLTTATAPGCDSQSPTPAFQQRLAYTSQTNSTVLNLRIRIKPLMDASLFKQFKFHESDSFEIRGEFFNVLNTANFGSPGTGLGSGTFGTIVKTQANDARIGQLTARVNF
jgi:hypothetical protein